MLALAAPSLAQAQIANTAAPAAPTDPFGRETPRTAVTALLRALAEQDYERAGNYFELPARTPASQGPELARRLQALLDKNGTLRPFGALSSEATGNLNDDLAPDREEVGTIPIGTTDQPVLLSRGTGADEVPIWRVAPETARQLLAKNVAVAAREAAPAADEATIAGAGLKDWAILLGLALVSFGGLWAFAALALLLTRRLVADHGTNGVYRFLHAALPPVSLLLAVLIFYAWAGRLPVSIVARQAALRYTGVIAVVAFVWFALRLVDAISDLAIARMRRSERRQVISVVMLLRRTAKLLLIAFSVVGVLDTFGIDVTTGIAALGIGGIALALGAQKTVENLVGSVTVIADRPAQVGDFVKVGDVVGTVEDVGIRSTRIRTNERTVVTIPNGDFSARQIENFATRDRFLFNPTIGVEYSLTGAKLRQAVDIVAGILRDHPKIAEGGRARLAKFGENSLDIEVFSYIDTPNFDESVVIREELLFAIFEQLEAAEIGIAFPTRTLMFSGEIPLAIKPPAPEDKPGEQG
ncbi:mechanosensitive ion channel family protein [Sphingomonas aracearum]|uniref:Mechanosensitive ion channel family protein n=1 Tax=Sphingomonas aracearum TaxID=2283317 RepID=A0A369VRI8_9SPHN|nr:mechanosensitive ion channel family protein [Sphingomonas aracearum]